MKELNAQVYLSENNFQIGNETCPGFLKSCSFQDEYEANLAWAI